METPTFTLAGIRQFHTWTHASLTVLFDHLATFPAADYAKGHPRLRLPHSPRPGRPHLRCEAFWVHHPANLSLRRRRPGRLARTVAEARTLQREVGLRTLNYLSRLSEQHLNSNTQMHFPDGDTAVRTPALILHHILTHAFHHKGQIVAMCRALGHPAPTQTSSILNRTTPAVRGFTLPASATSADLVHPHTPRIIPQKLIPQPPILHPSSETSAAHAC